MDLHRLLLCTPVLALAALAAIIDWRSRRIPNWITFTMVLSGFCVSALSLGPVSIGQSALGFLVGFALPLLLFLIGALGGGDVKLLAGLGAWLGPETTAKVFVLEAVIGLAIVLAQAVHQGRLRALARNSAVLAVNLAHMNDLGVEHVRQTGQSSRSVDRPLPYAVPVMLALGVLFVRSWR